MDTHNLPLVPCLAAAVAAVVAFAGGGCSGDGKVDPSQTSGSEVLGDLLVDADDVVDRRIIPVGAARSANTAAPVKREGATGAEGAKAAPGPEAEALGPEAALDPTSQPRGRLCSQPYRLSGSPGKGASRREESPAGYADAIDRLRRGFDVAVDGGERQRWSPERGIEFDGLDPRRRHTIMISAADGKRIRKLALDFRARGSDDLCLVYNDFYSTWQLRTLRRGQRCGPCVTL